jgi:hypothetical protein
MSYYGHYYTRTAFEPSHSKPPSKDAKAAIAKARELRAVEALADSQAYAMPEGRKISALSPLEAAEALADVFCLCADEDLAVDISCDLQLDYAKAQVIASELVKLRRR